MLSDAVFDAELKNAFVFLIWCQIKKLLAFKVRYYDVIKLQDVITPFRNHLQKFWLQ